MKLKDIYKFLDEIAPFETAESWDNSGLLLGDMEQEFSQIVLSLDLSSEVMQKAPNGSLIVTHHPFLFSSIKKIDFETSHGKLVKEAIKKDISIVAMHTNYDKSVLNRYFAENILGLQVVSCDGFVCKCEVDCEFEEILELVRNSLKIKNINFVAPQKSKVKTIGITTGSGSEMSSLPYLSQWQWQMEKVVSQTQKN